MDIAYFIRRRLAVFKIAALNRSATHPIAPGR
jgi:hypothetical protein